MGQARCVRRSLNSNPVLIQLCREHGNVPPARFLAFCRLSALEGTMELNEVPSSQCIRSFVSILRKLTHVEYDAVGLVHV
jgi:hypothetical protein